MRNIYGIAAALAASGALIGGGAQAGEVLDGVRDKGYIQCGVSQGLPGFSSPDDQGNWSGIDVDLCRGVAAALFGDSEAVRFTPLSASDRFTALQSGEIDILSRNTTWTITRDTTLGLNFAGVLYYDGQGFMVPIDLGLQSALELDGASVCVQSGTTTELNMADFFRANGMDFEPVVFENNNEMMRAYDSGRCDAVTTDASGLYAERTKVSDPSVHMILPEIISKEPLGPVVAHGDDEWLDIVKWTLFGMIEAEELGVNSENVMEMQESSDNPSVQRLLGSGDANTGEGLGLGADWAVNIISQVGNYGEVFESNLSETLNIDRGINALWTNGGLQYAMPVR